jgi:hypothetical protein
VKAFLETRHASSLPLPWKNFAAETSRHRDDFTNLDGNKINSAAGKPAKSWQVSLQKKLGNSPTKNVGTSFLNRSKLFFKEVLHIWCGPHPGPLLKKRRGGKCTNILPLKKFFDILTIL